MNKSFHDRLAALEALEAAQEKAEQGRRLEVWLQMRPAEYFVLCEDRLASEAARSQVWCAYGLDQLYEADRVSISGGTWPGVRCALADTIARVEWADGYGYWIDLAPWLDLALGETRWNLAASAEVEALRCVQRATALAGFDLVLAALADGRAVVAPLIYGCSAGGTYGALAYGLCGMGDPEVLRWGMDVDRLLRAAGDEPPTTPEAYTAWITAHRHALVDAWVQIPD